MIRAQGVHPVLRAILTNSSLTNLEGGRATIVCAPRFAPGAPKWIGGIAELLMRETGAPVEVRLSAADGGQSTTADVAAGEAEVQTAVAAPAPTPEPRVNIVQATEHPLVKQALELFGGRVVDVQPRKPS